MEKETPRMLLVTSILLLLGVTLPFNSIVAGSPTANVAVDPKITVKAPNETFNIAIVVNDVTELFVWEFNITFNPAVLEAVSYAEGDFLLQAGDTYPLPPSFNNTAGWMAAGSSLFPYPTNGASGNGTLAYVTFKVKAEGKTNLHLVGTKLRSWDAANGQLIQIQHTTVDGLFQYPLWRDIAVTSVTGDPVSVQSGQSLSISITVKNQGNVTETFNVNLSYDTKEIGTQAVTDLTPDASKTVQFNWETKDVPPGNYTLKATAGPLSGETNTADNTDSHLIVQVKAVPPMFSNELLIIIAIVMVAGLGVGVYLLRRRKSTKK